MLKFKNAHKCLLNALQSKISFFPYFFLFFIYAALIAFKIVLNA
ncbi:hypothetical protein CSUNSWCD_1539 [Campylobacter showae CSUNSWCD]|uniref:Uncharacterized protein n=1 Tax=Campylobacter showae CSUNSWCD TaxID=1244083 RepID=M5IQZ8_9BACT|nr:hypothetical protein CSUNSWCD_1539 [Campylobacter showae CSUNSWCD]